MMILWSNNTMPHTIPTLEPKYMEVYIYIYDKGKMWARHPLRNIQLPVHLHIPVREKERPSQLTMVVYRSNVLSFMTNQLTVLSCILFVSLTGTRRYYVSCSLFQKQHRQKRSTIRIRKHICWTSLLGVGDVMRACEASTVCLWYMNRSVLYVVTYC